MNKASRKRAALPVGAIFAACLLAGLPLYLYNGYYSLITGKTLFFYLAVGAAGLAALLLGQTAGKGRLKHCGLTALAGLCSVYALDLTTAADPRTAFWGLRGRYNGLFMLLVCTAAYLIVRLTVRGSEKKLLTDLFLGSAAVCAVIGWLNYFLIDPLGVFYSLTPAEGQMFISTVGNNNFFAALMAMSAATALFLGTRAQPGRQATRYGLLAVLLTSALFPANSDGGWVGFYAAMALLLCLKGTSSRAACRTLCAVGAAFAVGGVARSLSAFVPVRLPFSELSSMAGSMIPALFLLTAAWLLHRKDRDVTRLFRGLTLAAVILLILLTVLANCTDLALGALQTPLTFGPTWGSNRGYVWGRLCYLYTHEFSLWQKLVGIGGDGIQALINPRYTAYIVAFNAAPFDSAHNVYLQHLLCGGLLGLVCWCWFWAGRIRSSLTAKSPVLMALTAYCVQAFFSIDMPAVLPLAFVLAALADLPDETEAPDTRHILWGTLIACTALVFVIPAVKGLL